MKWKRKHRPAIGVSYWVSDSDYVKPGGKNSLKGYRECLETMSGRSKIFDIVVDHVKKNYDTDEKIRIHELGSNSGYNLEYIRKELHTSGYKKIQFTGNDSWEDAVNLGNKDFPEITLSCTLTGDLLKSVADSSEKIDIMISHSHLIHLTNEDLDLIYPAIKGCVSKCFFFEDFDLTETIESELASENLSSKYRLRTEELNKTNRLGVTIFGDAEIYSYIEKL